MSFKELINSDRPVLIDFYADWCGPCKAMTPIIKEVAGAVGDQASVIKINVDKNPKLASQLQIQGVPTFILYKNGEIKWRQAGMQSAQALKSLIAQHSETSV